MRLVIAVLVYIFIGCTTVGATRIAGAEDLILTGQGDTELDRFRELVVLFRKAVSERDIALLSELASTEDARFLRDKLADRNSTEYKLMFLAEGSPGALLGRWKNVIWVAARDRALVEYGGGALLCMASAAEYDDRWPPKASDLRKLQRSSDIFCIFTYLVDGERVLAFNFLYPEDGAL